MRRNVFAAVLAGLVSALSAAPWAAAQEMAPETAQETAPPRVAAIEIRSDSELSPAAVDQVRQLLALAVGEPLSEERVARTLRNVQASGIASLVDVYSRPATAGDAAATAPGDVVAVVLLRPNVVVTDVSIHGDAGSVDRADLEAALFQSAGEPLIESRLVRGVFRMQEIFEEHGYFEASVRLMPTVDQASRRAEVVYQVKAGPQARIAEVRFAGDLGPFSDAELRAPLRSRSGEAFRKPVAERDGERLQSWLVGRKYRTARVDAPRTDYRSEDARVVLTFPLQVGPEVRVEVVGAKRDKLRRRGLLPFLEDDGYDEALLLLAEQRLHSYYQERGHYDVRVETAERSEEGVLNVTVKIEPGPVFTLRQVRLSGNRQVSAERLRELMATREAGFLTGLRLASDGRLVDSVLSDDLDNLRAFYALQGYAEARIGAPQIERDGRNLSLTVPIREGPRQLVDDLTLRGVEALDVAELRRGLSLTEGGPYHPRLVDSALNQIRAAYERRGYAAARVSASTEWEPSHTAAHVTVSVLEGSQTVVDHVIVRGNRRTQPEVIRRTIGLQPGDPAARSQLLEAERDLYRLGIFSRVDLELTPAPLGATTRDVVARVEEGRVRSLRYGLSSEYNDEGGEWSVGGSLGFSHGNLFGRAITLSADARVLSGNEQYRLFVSQPTVGRWPLEVSYSLFRTQERRTSFDVTRRGLRVEAVRKLGDRTRAGLAYDYRIVDNAARASVVPLDDLRREDQRLQVASLVPSLVFDHRNDPLNPTGGWNGLLQLQYAFPILAAEAHYLKLFAQGTAYVPLSFGTLVVGARGGAIEPLSRLPDDVVDPFIPPGLGLPSSDVFLAERFFAGGETSHRAYKRDRLGIPLSTCRNDAGEIASSGCAATLFPDATGSPTPAGGNGLALVNVDLRIPLFGGLEGVLFFDTGNVWADWRQVDPTDFRSGTGIELRYASPVGPLRVGVGFPLDPVEGADDRVFFLSIGTPF